MIGYVRRAMAEYLPTPNSIRVDRKSRELLAIQSMADTDASIRDDPWLWVLYGHWVSDPPFVVALSGGGYENEPLVGFHFASFGKTCVNSFLQFVLPQYRGKGYAGMMVSAVLEEANKRGIPRMKFKVPKRSHGEAFWRGFGLTPFAESSTPHPRKGDELFFDVRIEGLVSARALQMANHSIICNPELITKLNRSIAKRQGAVWLVPQGG